MRQFAPSSVKWLVIIYPIFILLNSCSKLNLDESEPGNAMHLGRNIVPLELLIAIQDYMDENDTFQTFENGSLLNPLIQVGVHEFIQFISTTHFDLSIPVEAIPQNYAHSNVSERFDTFNLDFLITQKLDSEDENQQYIIKDILSELRGDLTGKNWDTISYTYQIQFGTAIIDYKGTLTYLVKIEDLEFIFKDYRHYKIILDIHTGQPLNMLEVNY